MSVVVPAYNEEAGIAATVGVLHERWSAFGRPYEILIVDNAQRGPHGRGRAAAARRSRACACCATRSTAARASRCGAECSTRAGSCGCSATPTARPSLGFAAATCSRPSRRPTWCPAPAWPRAPTSTSSSRFRRRLVGWPFIALTRGLMREPTRDVYCGFKLWSADGGRGGLLAPAPRRLGVRRRGAGAGAAARLPGHRGRRDLEPTGAAPSSRSREVLIPAVRELLAGPRQRAQAAAPRQGHPRACSRCGRDATRSSLRTQPSAEAERLRDRPGLSRWGESAPGSGSSGRSRGPVTTRETRYSGRSSTWSCTWAR